MALIGNRSVLHKTPGRFLNGTVASVDRSNFSKHGMWRAAAFDAASAVPSGHLAPSSWVLPSRPGAMSSRYEAISLSTAAGVGAMGVNIEGQSDGLSSAAGVGQLIVSGSGLASSTSSASGVIQAALLAAGLASSSSSAAAAIAAIGWMSGQAASSSSASLTSYAVGNMAGTTEALTELSPQAIAAAVWAASLEPGFDASRVMRIVAAATAGRASGGPAGFTARNLANTQDQLVGLADLSGNRTSAVYGP